jgi:UDP-N-acetylglucosamine acyltransferase
MKAAGIPMKPIGVNSIGLLRRDFPEEVVEQLRKAFKILYLSGLNTSQALSRLRAELWETEEVRKVVEFVEASSRGIVK